MSRRPTQHNTIGPLSAKSLELPHYLPPPQEWPSSDRVCNANAPKGSRYSAKKDLSYRGMEVRLPSRGLG